MKRLAPFAGLVAAALLGGCAVYPDGTPMYGNGYGYSGYEGYDGYAPDAVVVPQTNVYMGYGNYPGPGRYYGPGPGYHGYPDRGRPNDNDWHHGDRGDRGGGPGQPHGGPPPQGAAGGPRGPSGWNGPHPGAGGPPPGQPQAQQQGGNGGGHGGTWGRSSPNHSGQMNDH